MCVGVGSFSDPIDAQGLAHFLGMCLMNLNWWLRCFLKSSQACRSFVFSVSLLSFKDSELHG